MTALVLFDQDLRLYDNPAWHAASKEGYAVIPAYISYSGRRELGTGQRWWLAHSLRSLSDSLDGTLVYRAGNLVQTVGDLIHESGAEKVFWNQVFDPQAAAQYQDLAEALDDRGIEAGECPGNLLMEPWALQPQGGPYFKVYSPFWKKLRMVAEPNQPLPAPTWKAGPKVKSDPLPKLPKQDLPWKPGEAEARSRLQAFVRSDLESYDTMRDLPGDDRTSRLSPHLHWGELSVREVWHAVQKAKSDTFLSEIAWRDYSYHLLHHFPTLPRENYKRAFDRFAWEEDAQALQKWKDGQTGYPIVDAGMRQLKETGWMHNRVRMIVGSFLIKDLLIHWREGEQWFWELLVDADHAQNPFNWQWVAGCGADAAPYFRIFNPVLQGEKFDADGTYVRRWVPELEGISGKKIHSPWTLSESELRQAGVALGSTYPEPMLDHKEARERALALYKAL